MFVTSLGMGLSVPLSAHSLNLRAVRELSFLYCSSTPEISSGKESADLNNQITNVILTSTRLSKEKAAKLEKGGVLLDLIILWFANNTGKRR